MPGLLRSHANSTSFLGQMKVSVSRSHAPKQIHSTITSRAISISPEKASWDNTNTYPAYVITAAGSAGTYQPTLTINDLPPEILAEIFHIYLFWEDESDLIDPELEGLISVIEPSSRAAPLLFCQICSYWRNVAISTPSLWSSIALKETLQLDTVKLWLQRSRNHPLSFAIWLSSSRSDPANKWARWPELLNLLCSSIHRWRDILLRVPTTNDMCLFMAALLPSKGSSPALMLRTLDVSNKSFSEYMDQETIDRLSSFPHPTIRRLTWEDDTLPKFGQLDTTMWENLQQLNFAHVTPGVLCAFLKACPNTHFVSANSLLASCSIDLPANPVIAKNLRALHIGAVAGDVFDALRFIITPQLQRLSYHHKGNPEETNRLVNFLTLSQCHLTSLSIHSQAESFDDGEVQKMLTSKPITDIPSVSIRMSEDHCHPSFPQSFLTRETNKHKSAKVYANHEPQNYRYHLGWGNYDFIRKYVRYPFLMKSSSQKPKWHVFLADGPLTSV